MKIAVTYDQGTVFQHFGHSKQFKIYEVANDQITASQVVESGANGHDAIASFLVLQNVDVVICGGMGDGAQQALSEAGIEICTGAEGDADEAVAAYLRGELVSAGVNCDHHHGDNEDEGCGCGGNCGSGCGGCGGGCGGGRPMITGKNAGKKCRVHYRGTFNDGTQFDASYDRNEPLEFVCAAGMMIPGFDAAVANMNVGDAIDIHLMPEEAYGPADPRAILTLPIAQLPGSEELSVGEQVYLTNAYGQPIPVKVTAKDDTMITLDANHEMAGKELNFHIELIEVQ